MPRPRVYVETTIPSAYFDERLAPGLVARREWTRRWWRIAREQCDLVTASPVFEELAEGPEHRHGAWLSLIRDLPRLPFDPFIDVMMQTYVQHKLMPSTSGGGDALHLALASFHECDFLVTWNYRHLANPNKRHHIRVVNTRLGVFVPQIVTPRDLLGEAS